MRPLDPFCTPTYSVYTYVLSTRKGRVGTEIGARTSRPTRRSLVVIVECVHCRLQCLCLRLARDIHLRQVTTAVSDSPIILFLQPILGRSRASARQNELSAAVVHACKQVIARASHGGPPTNSKCESCHGRLRWQRTSSGGYSLCSSNIPECFLLCGPAGQMGSSTQLPVLIPDIATRTATLSVITPYITAATAS